MHVMKSKDQALHLFLRSNALVSPGQRSLYQEKGREGIYGQTPHQHPFLCPIYLQQAFILLFSHLLIAYWLVGSIMTASNSQRVLTCSPLPHSLYLQAVWLPPATQALALGSDCTCVRYEILQNVHCTWSKSMQCPAACFAKTHHGA